MVQVLTTIASIFCFVLLIIIFKELDTEEINIEDIKIKESFKKSTINDYKLWCKEQFFLDKGYFVDKVILDYNNVLLDGYSTYLIAKDFNIKKLKITRDKNM